MLAFIHQAHLPRQPRDSIKLVAVDIGSRDERILNIDPGLLPVDFGTWTKRATYLRYLNWESRVSGQLWSRLFTESWQRTRSWTSLRMSTMCAPLFWLLATVWSPPKTKPLETVNGRIFKFFGIAWGSMFQNVPRLAFSPCKPKPADSDGFSMSLFTPPDMIARQSGRWSIPCQQASSQQLGGNES